jgi:hypothetical protein
MVWLLVTGYWLLVAGCRLPVAGFFSPPLASVALAKEAPPLFSLIFYLLS